MPEFIETIIVGGGQAGLAISFYLKQGGREHLVLERAPAIASAWRNQRWDLVSETMSLIWQPILRRVTERVLR